MNETNESAWQSKIDAIRWYHEFDFGNDLKARSLESDVEWHRRVWSFIRNNLASIDFQGKTVLDVGTSSLVSPPRRNWFQVADMALAAALVGRIIASPILVSFLSKLLQRTAAKP